MVDRDITFEKTKREFRRFVECLLPIFSGLVALISVGILAVDYMMFREIRHIDSSMGAVAVFKTLIQESMQTRPVVIGYPCIFHGATETFDFALLIGDIMVCAMIIRGAYSAVGRAAKYSLSIANVLATVAVIAFSLSDWTVDTVWWTTDVNRRAVWLHRICAFVASAGFFGFLLEVRDRIVAETQGVYPYHINPKSTDRGSVWSGMKSARIVYLLQFLCAVIWLWNIDLVVSWCGGVAESWGMGLYKPPPLRICLGWPWILLVRDGSGWNTFSWSALTANTVLTCVISYGILNAAPAFRPVAASVKVVFIGSVCFHVLTGYDGLYWYELVEDLYSVFDVVSDFALLVVAISIFFAITGLCRRLQGLNLVRN